MSGRMTLFSQKELRIEYVNKKAFHSNGAPPAIVH